MEYYHILDSFMNGNFSQMVEQMESLNDYQKHLLIVEFEQNGYGTEIMRIFSLFYKIIGQR